MTRTATLTAADVERGRPETSAERRERLDFLTPQEWRERIAAAVSYSLRRSGGWSDDDRDELTAELWADAWEQVEARSSTIGRVIERAVLRYYGVTLPSSATPRRDDDEHSTAAYYGRAGNARGRLLTEHRRIAAAERVQHSADADELTADDIEDDDEPRDERARGDIGAAELSGQSAAAAKVIADRLVKRLKLPVYDLAYAAARSHTETLRVTADTLRELGLTARQWEDRKAEQVALIAAECDDPADLIRFLSRGCQPRDGHIGRDDDGAPTYYPATLSLRPRAKAARVPTPVLVWAPPADAAPASKRHGRSLAEAGERARMAPLEAAVKQARADAAALAKVKREQRGPVEPSSEQIAAEYRTPRPKPSTDLPAPLSAMPDGTPRATGSAAAAAAFSEWQATRPEDGNTAERIAASRRRVEWREHGATERTARLAELVAANRHRRAVENLRRLEPGLSVQGARGITAAERETMPAWETDNGRSY